VNLAHCPGCSAYWIASSTSCRFCGYATLDGTATGSPAAPVAPPPRPSRVRGLLGGAALLVGVAAIAGAVVTFGPDLRDRNAAPPTLADVCDGTGFAGAAAHPASTAATGLVELDADTGQRHVRAKDKVVNPDLTDARIDVVACRRVLPEVYRTKTCRYRYHGDGEIVTFTTAFQKTEIVLRSARTGAALATFTAMADPECATEVQGTKRGETVVINGSKVADGIVDGYLGAAAKPI
jgi:hypothetical protein